MDWEARRKGCEAFVPVKEDVSRNSKSEEGCGQSSVPSERVLRVTACQRGARM